MITYNPKDWWKLIFAFHKSDTFRILFPALIGLAAFTGIIAYLEIDYWHLNFKNVTVGHTLIGFVLSLLLVFRTNSAYDRWWEGRKIWGSFNNNARNLAMKLNAMLPQERTDLRHKFKALIYNHLYASKEHLRAGVNVEELIETGIYDHAYYKKHNHIPNAVHKAMYVEVINLQKAGILSDEDIRLISSELQSFTDNIGACERIRNTPIPYTYTIFLKKIIFFYTFSMPIGFVMEFGYWACLIVPAIFYAFASVELIGEEIEDPFGDDANDLPTDTITERVKANIEEIL
jgi:ion channel-forming bestrophin family protein